MSESEWIEVERPDYVVVGAGSAGCVVAARLSEDPDAKVLLIEAGGEDVGEIFDVPSQWGRQFLTDNDWCYWSEPEPHMGGRRNYLPRGKVLGGTSSINGLLYVRGVPLDYDEWAGSGCEGWAWEEVLPYFKRAEGNLRGSDGLHSGDGPLKVEDRIRNNPLSEAWVEAAVAAGLPANRDFNGPDQEGAGFFQLTQSRGTRCSTSAAYLRPAMSRPNLRVLTFSRVLKVNVTGQRATGVVVERLGRRHSIEATSEVILCGGAYNSPQLLMLSGIGPAADLAEMGIPVIEDLPVGRNLQEHPGSYFVFTTDMETLKDMGSDADWAHWRSHRDGPLVTNIVEAGGFWRSNPGLPTPDLESCFMPGLFSEEGLGEESFRAFTVVSEVLRPTSTGTVRLRSSDPTAQPRITHNHFATEEDRLTLVEGLRINMRIAETSPIKELETGRPCYPESDSDEDLLAHIADHGFGLFHPTSSCPMGAVLDSRLRVHGVEGLRVADASVMPKIVRGNPNGAVVMIGEKAADLIRAG